MENAPKTMGKELTPSSGGSRTHVVPGSVRLPPPNPSKIRPAVRSRSVDPGFAGRPLEPLGYPLEPLGHEMIWDDMSHESKLDTKQSIFGSSWFPPSHAMAAMPWPIFRLGIKLLRHVRCGQWRQRLQQGLNVLLGAAADPRPPQHLWPRNAWRSRGDFHREGTANLVKQNLEGSINGSPPRAGWWKILWKRMIWGNCSLFRSKMQKPLYLENLNNLTQTLLFRHQDGWQRPPPWKPWNSTSCSVAVHHLASRSRLYGPPPEWAPVFKAQKDGKPYVRAATTVDIRGLYKFMIRSLCIKDFYWFCWTSCFFGKSNFQAGLISELSPQTHSQLEIYHKKSLSFPSIPGIPGTLSNRLKTSSLGWWMVASTVFCVAVPSPRAKPCSSFITLSLGQCQVNRALKFEVYEVGYAMVDLENWWWGWWWWWWWWW